MTTLPRLCERTDSAVCVNRDASRSRFTLCVSIKSSPFLPRCMKCRRRLAMRILSVRPSVCVSVKLLDCDKTEEKSDQIFIPYGRSFSLVFLEKEWLLRGDPFYPKFWDNRPPLERNGRFLTDNRL